MDRSNFQHDGSSQSQTEFRASMQRLCEGSDDAAWNLVSSYGSIIQRVVRRSLHRELRSKFDSVDFVQAVWASFFRNRELFANLDNPGSLIGFLSAVARNKVLQEIRKRTKTAKTDIRRECALDGGEAQDSRLRDREPSPSQWAIARERWNSIVVDQSDQHRRVIEMRIAGATYEEIGTALEMSERTARRVIDRLVEGLGE
jgi:RNA polymerase sigma-70 factor (ECF subfamily)